MEHFSGGKETMSRTLWIGLACTLLSAAAFADDGRLATVSDMGAALPGATTVTSIGTLPAAPGSREIAQMPGWPITVATHLQIKPARGAVLADLDNDGDLEIIVGTTDKKIYAWDYTGVLMPGFPVTLNNWVQYPPSVADIDGDGWLEIVAGTRGPTTGGRLYVIDHLGAIRPGYPLSVNNRNISLGIVLYDLDNDGQKEMIVGEQINPGKIHIYRPNGTEWTTGWPVLLDHTPAVTPAVADIDQDGAPEIVTCSYNSLYAINLDGTLLPGFPVQIPNAKFSYQSPVLVDLDGDGYREIVVGAHSNAPGCYIYRYDGTPYANGAHPVENWSYCPPTVTDLENDGTLDIIFSQSAGSTPPTNVFWAWDSNGNLKTGFPYVSDHGGGAEGPITVADVNGDGRMEIFMDQNVTDGVNGWLLGVDADGVNLPGFPLRPVGFTYLNGAAIGDVDGDGHYELAVVSYSDTTSNVNLYTLPDTYRRTSRDWTQYHGSPTRVGAFAAVLVAGDLDCDGLLSFADINPFAAALNYTNGQGWPHVNCPWLNADCNADGVVDFKDINPFVTLLIDSMSGRS
jgi:hypothetical protein